MGDGNGLLIDFKTDELLGTDAEAVHFHARIATQGGDEFEHFGFEPFHVLHGDVEEVRGAAGWIEDAELAEAAVEGDDLL